MPGTVKKNKSNLRYWRMQYVLARNNFSIAKELLGQDPDNEELKKRRDDAEKAYLEQAAILRGIIS